MATGDRLFVADKQTLDSVNTKVGVNTDAGGTTTLFARVRQIFEQLTTMSSTALSRTVWTDARAQRLDSIVNSPSNRSIFTANGIFTVPAGVNAIIVTACGAGGNGGTGSSSGGSGGGGGGGACIIRNSYTVAPAQVINITVGAGIATVLSGIVTLGTGGAGGNGGTSTAGTSGSSGGSGGGGGGTGGGVSTSGGVGIVGAGGTGGNGGIAAASGDGSGGGGGGGSLTGGAGGGGGSDGTLIGSAGGICGSNLVMGNFIHFAFSMNGTTPHAESGNTTLAAGGSGSFGAGGGGGGAGIGVSPGGIGGRGIVIIEW